MSIFTDVVSTISKSTLNKILMYIFLGLIFIFMVNKLGGWLSDKFTNEPTRDQLVVQNSQQSTVIDAQTAALENKDESIDLAKDLTKAAIKSMEDYSQDNVKSVTKQAQISANLDKAQTVNKAEVIKINVLEKDEAIKKQKLLEADQRLAETQELEIQAAYNLALKRSGLQPS